MTGFWIEMIILALGYAAAVLLFWRIPHLPNGRGAGSMRISVVIPARNEALTLPLLLGDLSRQSLPAYEIIVVSDASEDDTAGIARSFGAAVLDLRNKPEGWVGKSWACQQGALSSKGDVLLFLDADVRLGVDGLSRLAAAYAAHGTLSVQPYHSTLKAYEQGSLVFNLVQIAANGSALPHPVNLGLFGPIVAISRPDYFTAGGHESVKSAVVEDLALAARLRRANIPFHIFVGDGGVSFRMYPDGFGSLWQGFTKNLATGASKTPVGLLLLVVLFLASLGSAPLHLILSLARGEALALLYGVLYAVWIFALFLVSRRIGRYRPLAVLLYPLPLLMFFCVFLHSGLLRLFHGKVMWKGRAIPLER